MHYTLCITGQYLLQLKVVVCFLILVAGRVINVFVPIFYKIIVTELTTGQNNQTNSYDVSFTNALGIENTIGIVFPLTPICIYVVLKFLQVRVHVHMCTYHFALYTYMCTCYCNINS